MNFIVKKKLMVNIRNLITASQVKSIDSKTTSLDEKKAKHSHDENIKCFLTKKISPNLSLRFLLLCLLFYCDRIHRHTKSVLIFTQL